MTDLLSDATQTDTRLIFANELAPGAVIVQPCEGYYRTGELKCRVEALAHGDQHKLTILRVRTGSFGMSAIVVDEGGHEGRWSEGGNAGIRVTIDSPVEPQPDKRPDRVQVIAPIHALPLWKKVLGAAAGIATVLVPFALGAAAVLLVLAGHAGSR